MKKIIKLILSILLVFVLLGCNNEDEKYAYVSIEYDLNVEFILNQKNRICAYNGKDDRTKAILLNEVFIDKKIDEAITNLFKLSSNTGFLLPGEKSDIVISVGGSMEKEKLHILEMKITNMCENSLTSSHVSGAVKIENLKNRIFFEEKIISEKPYYKDIVTTLSVDSLMSQMIEIIKDNNEYISTNFIDELVFMMNNDVLLSYYKEASKLVSNNESLNSLISEYESKANDFYNEEISFLLDSDNDYNKTKEEVISIEKDYIYYRYASAVRKYLDVNDKDISNKYNEIIAQYDDSLDKMKIYQSDYEKIKESHKDELKILSMKIDSILDELFSKEEINNLKKGIINNNTFGDCKTKLNALITSEKLKMFEDYYANYKEGLKNLIKEARLMK